MVHGGKVVDVGSKVVDVAYALLPLYPGVAGPGVGLLRDDGAVFILDGVPSDKPALPPVRIEHGLPPIARLHGDFYEDRDAKIWFFGVSAPESWPLGLIASDVPRFPCTVYFGNKKGDSPPSYTQCVRPVEIPALAHTAPTLAFADMAIVTVTPDGKLLCWPNIGRTCQKLE